MTGNPKVTKDPFQIEMNSNSKTQITLVCFDLTDRHFADLSNDKIHDNINLSTRAKKTMRQSPYMTN